MPSYLQPIAVLARLALVEARRGGLAWSALALVVVALGMGGFLAEVALAESAALQASVVGAFLRVAAAFVLAAHVVASTQREAADKTIGLALALPISRTQYYLGRLAGFAAAGAVLAVLAALPLFLWSAPRDVLAWMLAQAAEGMLVAAAALFFAMTLAHYVPALAASAGLYLLGRTIGAMQAIAAGPLSDGSLAGRAARFALEAIALIAPPLDGAARGDWLLYGAPGGGACAAALAPVLVYAALLCAAGLVDFHRRNL